MNVEFDTWNWRYEIIDSCNIHVALFTHIEVFAAEKAGSPGNVYVVSAAKEAKAVTSDFRWGIINSNSVSVGIIGCVLINEKLIQEGIWMDLHGYCVW